MLYNFTGGTFAHQGSFSTHVGDVVNGTILAPFYDMNLDGTWNGALIGGPISIGLLSGAQVNYQGFSPPPRTPSTPEPSTFVIAGLGALGFIGYRLRRRSKA